MDDNLIRRLISDDSFLYSELKKLIKEIQIEENKDFQSSIESAAEHFSFYIYQSKKQILYRFYDYDGKINAE